MSLPYVPSVPQELHGIVTVVGNADLSKGDRKFIASSSKVIRFNDIHNANNGDVTTYHVIRLPSAGKPQIAVHAPVWYVSPLRRILPQNVSMSTIVYERQYELQYIHEADKGLRVLFPSCGDSRCATDHTLAGSSTGGVVLSALSESPNVTKVHVLGMNWNGPAYLHTDFAWRGMVRTCCTKCVIHPTLKPRYGPGLPVVLYVVSCAAFVSVILLVIWKGVRHVCTTSRRSAPLLYSEEET